MITAHDLENAQQLHRDVTIFRVEDAGVTERLYQFRDDRWHCYRGGKLAGTLEPGYGAIYKKLTGRHAEKEGKVFLSRGAAEYAYRQSLEARIRSTRAELARLEGLLQATEVSA